MAQFSETTTYEITPSSGLNFNQGCTSCRDVGLYRILRLWKWLPRKFHKGRTTGCQG